MILDLHRKTFDGRIEARAFWNSPTFHDPVELEAQVEMQVTRCVFLDDEPETTARRRRWSFIAGGLGRPFEIALFSVFAKLGASAWSRAPSSARGHGCWLR
jgi:hypothetical protein